MLPAFVSMNDRKTSPLRSTAKTLPGNEDDFIKSKYSNWNILAV